MDKLAVVLGGLRRDGLGLEIGPGHAPLAAGDPAFKVRTLDHLDQAGLIAKLAQLGVDTARVPPIDYVWSGERYSNLVSGTLFAWILASHVIEHVPDLAGFLVQCEEILEAGGVVSLVVPDKRFCFDHYRPPSGLSQAVDAYLERRVRSSPGQVVECEMNFARLDGQDLWARTHPGSPTRVNSTEHARAMMGDAEAGEYVDGHNWVFTPNSFRLLIHDLHALGFIKLRESVFAESEIGEFYIQLAREPAVPVPDRQTLAALAVADLNLGGEALERENERLKAELALIHASSSWRLTAPLRAARRRLG